MTENHFPSHFIIFCTKWPPVAILDDRKSLSIAFLAISDQYTTFFHKLFHHIFTKWPPAPFRFPIFSKIERVLLSRRARGISAAQAGEPDLVVRRVGPWIS